MPEPIDEQAQATGGQELSDPGYSYDELKKESVRDIAGNTEIPEDKPKEEEKPPEEKPEETKEPETPAIDPKQLAEDAANAVLEKQKADQEAQEAAQIAKEKAEKTPTQEYQEIVKDFETKEGRAPTWDELAVKIEERSVAKLLDLQEKQRITAEEAQRVQAEQQKQQVQQKEADEKHLNTVIDDELDDLYKANKLTRIADKDNPSDPGNVERKALFDTWAKVNTERRSKGLPDIVSATRIYEFYYKKPTQQPGSNAPISGNRTSATPPGTEQEYSYEDIKRPWHWFKKR